MEARPRRCPLQAPPRFLCQSHKLPAVAWLLPLANRRFSGLLLIWAGLPILLLYVWQAVVQPLVFGAYLGDFQESYMRAAGRLAAGHDPYDLCQSKADHAHVRNVADVQGML